ncbi:MAG: hypothetical protein JO062_03475 [Bryobacterales bacterium]|nr:hypothetical protein [Bryobacterales bacterium]
MALTAAAQAPAPPAQAGRGGRIAPPPRILSFTAQPSTVDAGKRVALTWATENPSGVSIDPDIGRVTPRGTRQVSPAGTTTYTLTVGGPNNTTVTSSVTVTVRGSAAASAAKPASETKPARMPDGKPDLSGVYGFAGARGATPPSLKPGAEKFKIVRGPNDVRGTTTLGTDCKPLGIPQSFATPYPFQIVQTPKLLVMIFEYPNAVRMIPLDGRPHPADPDPTWMGDGIGRWDGDTLVVDSVGFNDKTEVNGYMHTEALHVVERYKKLDNGNLQYEVTVEDPNVFAGPWVMPARTFPFRPELEKVDEFVCENTQDYEKLFGKK